MSTQKRPSAVRCCVVWLMPIFHSALLTESCGLQAARGQSLSPAVAAQAATPLSFAQNRMPLTAMGPHKLADIVHEYWAEPRTYQQGAAVRRRADGGLPVRLRLLQQRVRESARRRHRARPLGCSGIQRDTSASPVRQRRSWPKQVLCPCNYNAMADT